MAQGYLVGVFFLKTPRYMRCVAESSRKSCRREVGVCRVMQPNLDEKW